LVKPVQIRLVIGDPFLDGLPRWLDGLDGFDVEGWRGRAREMDNALAEAVEAEEEFDFLVADHGAGDLHRDLKTLPRGNVFPQAEAQVRPLLQLPDSEHQVTVWATAAAPIGACLDAGSGSPLTL
jgi:hypothetical protein